MTELMIGGAFVAGWILGGFTAWKWFKVRVKRDAIEMALQFKKTWKNG